MITTLLAGLKKSGIVTPQRPASVLDISTTASMLGVRFPARYVEFLRTCGVLNIYDRSVFGLGPYTKRRDRTACSVGFQTTYSRDYLGGILPAHFVVIWNESHADCECLDTSRISRGDCPIVHFDPTDKRGGKPIIRDLASGLEEWITQKVNEQIKWKVTWETIATSRPRGAGKVRAK